MAASPAFWALSSATSRPGEAATCPPPLPMQSRQHRRQDWHSRAWRHVVCGWCVCVSVWVRVSCVRVSARASERRAGVRTAVGAGAEVPASAFRRASSSRSCACDTRPTTALGTRPANPIASLGRHAAQRAAHHLLLRSPSLLLRRRGPGLFRRELRAQHVDRTLHLHALTASEAPTAACSRSTVGTCACVCVPCVCV